MLRFVTGRLRGRPASSGDREFLFAVRRAASLPEGDCDFIEEIALLPEAQGRGIGTRLVRDVLQAAQRRGVPVRLSVFTSNPARVLYARLGFRVTGIEEPRMAMEWRPDGV